ncbi:MAG TPA: hypothetical protein VFB70_07155 [Pyrinomonadaceae bacterium]|nr:hypothetical protein [Pyrinomonadaceae bacterium]
MPGKVIPLPNAAAVKAAFSELNALLCEWDPIGVGPDGPRDEYECLVGPLLMMLQSGATQDEIASYLEIELVEHFGLEPNRESMASTVSRVCTWWSSSTFKSQA